MKKFQLILGFFAAFFLIGAVGFQQVPGLTRGAADQRYIRKTPPASAIVNPGRSTYTPAQLLPNWATEGFTTKYPVNFVRSSEGRWSIDLEYKSTLPTDTWNTVKWQHFWVDPDAGNNANSGTAAAPFRDISFAISQTTQGVNSVSNLVGGANPVVTVPYVHGLAVGDWQYLLAQSGNVLAAGWYQVSAVTSTTFTLGINSSGGVATASNGTFTSGFIPRPRVIHLKTGSTFWYGATGTGVNWNGATAVSHVVIAPDDGLDGTGTVTSSMQAKPSGFTWTLLSGTTWQATTGLSIGYVFDSARPDRFGQPGKYGSGPVADIATCQSTPQSWVYSGGNMYVNTGRTTNPQNDLVLCRATADGFHGDNPGNMWIDRINFKYGDRPFYIAPFATTTYRPIVSISKSKFNNSTLTDGFHNEGNIELYLFGCEASYNESDGFNHRATTGTSVWVVESGCWGKYNGALATTAGDTRTSANYGSNQTFTTHINTKLIGAGGEATGNGGQGIFDTATTASCYTYCWRVGYFSWNQLGTNDNITYTGTKFNVDFGVGSIAGATAEKLYLIDSRAADPETLTVSSTTFPASIQQFSGATIVTSRNIAPTSSACKLAGSGSYANYVSY